MKTTSKLFFAGLFVFILYSCHTSSNIVGTYSTKMDSKTFVLNSDSTFRYSCSEDLYSVGKWQQIDKHMIILNSDIRSSIVPLDIDIISTENEKDHVIKVKMITDGKSEKLYICEPYVEDFIFPSFWPDRGSYEFSTITIDQIYFKIHRDPMVIERLGPGREYNVLTTEHKKLNLTKGDEVNITVHITDSLFSYKVFSNTKLKVKRDKLIFRDKNKTNKLSLRK
ncbi:MAG: hypothetical protein LBO74_10440 [Candidatus Symbiothrix sp.]|jgi:hypothetical protein|nr:hypothetical protein [Candidatus Symbiothrix sp.]